MSHARSCLPFVSCVAPHRSSKGICLSSFNLFSRSCFDSFLPSPPVPSSSLDDRSSLLESLANPPHALLYVHPSFDDDVGHPGVSLSLSFFFSSLSLPFTSTLKGVMIPNRIVLCLLHDPLNHFLLRQLLLWRLKWCLFDCIRDPDPSEVSLSVADHSVLRRSEPFPPPLWGFVVVWEEAEGVLEAVVRFSWLMRSRRAASGSFLPRAPRVSCGRCSLRKGKAWAGISNPGGGTRTSSFTVRLSILRESSCCCEGFPGGTSGSSVLTSREGPGGGGGGGRERSVRKCTRGDTGCSFT